MEIHGYLLTPIKIEREKAQQISNIIKLKEQKLWAEAWQAAKERERKMDMSNSYAKFKGEDL